MLESLSAGLAPLCSQRTFPVVPDVALLLLLAAPHFLYAFIWFMPEVRGGALRGAAPCLAPARAQMRWPLRPQVWRRAFGDKSVVAFSVVSYFGKRGCRRCRARCASVPPHAKHGPHSAAPLNAAAPPAARAVAQFGAVLVWFGSSRANGICLDSKLVSLPQFTLFLQLLAVGQALNIGIYRAIGEAGVYYGFKLGHTVPWHTGFPFNVVNHPQYVGSVASVLAFAVLVMQQAPSGLWILTGYWTLLYLITGVWEHCC
jgi:hypothetical protein